LIQVCYDIDDLGTRERELKSLIKASKELKCEDLLVITWDYEAEEEFKEKVIKFASLWKWLL
jgi:predicted AAA+ superfamily ATPase